MKGLLARYIALSPATWMVDERELTMSGFSDSCIAAMIANVRRVRVRRVCICLLWRTIYYEKFRVIVDTSTLVTGKVQQSEIREIGLNGNSAGMLAWSDNGLGHHACKVQWREGVNEKSRSCWRQTYARRTTPLTWT
jgi:hypothetical protein